MKEAMILFPQTMILLALMVCGYLAVKRNWLTAEGWRSLNQVTVKLLYPFLMLSIVSSYDYTDGSDLVRQNLLLVVLYYVVMVLTGYLFVWIRKPPKSQKNLEILMVIFSNIGFVGIPLVRALYGDGFAFYVLFYIMGFNLLCFTYGVYLASDGGQFDWKSFFNAGTIGTIAAILIYLFRIPIAAPIQSFFDYLGGMIIPTSMILIGGSVAQQDLKEVLTSRKNYLVSAGRLFLAPLLGAVAVRFLPFDPRLKGVFVLLCAMPIGATAGTLAEVYCGRGKECNSTIALSTIACVVTIPLVFALYTLVS